MARGHDVLDFLCFGGTLITEAQISRSWGFSLRRARDLAKAFVGEGLLETANVRSPPMLPLESPLFVWRPGQPHPKFGSLSHRARSRWVEAASTTRVYFASKRAAALFGGSSITRGALLQARHELHMTEIFLKLRQEDPTAGKRWVRGAHFAGMSVLADPVPDAVIPCSCGCGRFEQAIEFISAYSSVRIRGFHEFCKSNEIPYVLW